MERFNLKKLNDVKGQEPIVLRRQIGLQLWKTWTLRWKIIVLGKLIDKILKNQPNIV
jgi:hypothetical protein